MAWNPSTIIHNMSGLDLNDAGDVVVRATITEAGQVKNGIVRINTLSGSFTRVVSAGDTVDGKTLTGMSAPRINSSGEVTFFDRFDGGAGLFTPHRLLVAEGDTVVPSNNLIRRFYDHTRRGQFPKLFAKFDG